MIRSMTGYGTAACAEKGISYAVEVRSVNHRHLKLMLRLPESWQFAEAVMEKTLRHRLLRGSISCILHVRDETGSAPMNLAVAQRYVDALSQLRWPEHVQATVDLGAVATLPGVCHPAEVSEEERSSGERLVERLTSQAVDALVAMREQEGATLREALLGCCREIRQALETVRARAPQVVDEYHDRLRTRVAALMSQGGFELQADALAREVAIYAERCDITEEVTRLASHLDQCGELCDRSEPVGRTLDFLTQELLREANTIASKSNDAAIARAVVEIKGQIDRLKEQAQNVE